jgi:hypothetical protein
MITGEEKTQWFIDLYIAALRAYWGNPFLKEPNPTSERYAQLDKARQIVDMLEGDYSEYIHLQFQAFKQLKIAPKPYHLISDNAVKRYQAYQKRTNRYYTEDYSVNGDFLTVSKTRKIYPLSQILLPTSQDSTALYAYSLSKMENDTSVSEDTQKRNRESVLYLIAKLKYKKVQVPKSIIELAKKLE